MIKSYKKFEVTERKMIDWNEDQVCYQWEEYTYDMLDTSVKSLVLLEHTWVKDVYEWTEWL